MKAKRKPAVVAIQNNTDVVPVKRRPGRPKGSMPVIKPTMYSAVGKDGIVYNINGNYQYL